MSIELLKYNDFSAPSAKNEGGSVRAALKAASGASGVDFAYLAANAALESGLDPSAKAKTSSAAGLFQFIDATWMDMVERHGAKVGLGREAAALAEGELGAKARQRVLDLRYDPNVAARLGAEFAAENAAVLEKHTGEKPDDTDLYLAHFLGPRGAVKFLGKLADTPDAAAADAFAAAASANRAVFYQGERARSFAEIRDRFADKLAAGYAEATPPGASGLVWKSPTPETTFQAAVGDVATAEEDGDDLQERGDPWLTTLITAQLTLNDEFTQVRRDGPNESRAETKELGNFFS